MNGFQKYNNEKGFALILALSMLAIMSILGAFALMTSTTEVQISGNYSAGQRAFFAADRGVEFAEALLDDAMIPALLDPDGNLDTSLMDGLRNDGRFSLIGWADELAHDRSGLVVVPGTNNILRIGARLSDSDGVSSGFQYYDVVYGISVTGGFFNVANNPRMTTRIETQRRRDRIPASSWLGGDFVGGSSDQFITTDGG